MGHLAPLPDHFSISVPPTPPPRVSSASSYVAEVSGPVAFAPGPCVLHAGWRTGF